MWQQLYLSPQPLRMDDAHRRIFSPESYKRIRELSLVPIIPGEAITLAAWFPICWQHHDAGLELVALRSLLPQGLAIPHDALRTRAALPLALHAYPIVIGPRHGVDSGVIVDQDFADRPTDAGAPLVNLDGSSTKAALQRIAVAAAMEPELDMRIELTLALQQAGLFDPWPLRFDLSQTRKLDIANLSVLSSDRVAAGEGYDVLRRFGPWAGRFIAAQRLSLFRISTLLTTARKAVRAAEEAVLNTARKEAEIAAAAAIGISSPT
jgi:hypothetical protein